MEAGTQTAALRSGDWEYVPPGKRGRMEDVVGDPTDGPPVSTGPLLYDQGTDPGEMHNVADAHPDLVKQFMAELQAEVGH